MSGVGWAQAAATLFVGFVGLWLVHSYRRQARLKLIERQLDAYQKLWTLTAPATPERTTPMTGPERVEVHDAMVNWYFTDGDGIFASAPTRDIFVAFRTNLVCPVESMVPRSLAADLAQLPAADAERRRGCVAIRQASLLRAQLKADLSLHFGLNYYSRLLPEDRAFLTSCGISTRRRPWRSSPVRKPRLAGVNNCVCGLCPTA
ncbi:hypothetical protein [Paractinoplanes globisporus]|uniref:Uncharacterized protein n=1 Tax=Paractinoplanes globisporus TaxID=113565 RepID=A0ABW6WUK9_9ACTN|nr:hypothetical protein [Actinoplanes globisporus]